MHMETNKKQKLTRKDLEQRIDILQRILQYNVMLIAALSDATLPKTHQNHDEIMRFIDTLASQVGLERKPVII